MKKFLAAFLIHQLRLITATGFLIFISWCFSGCGPSQQFGGYTENSSQQVSQLPVETTPDEPGGPECGSMDPESCEVFKLTNEERRKQGLPDLVICETCVKAAEEQSAWMVASGTFSHDRPGETFAQRMSRWKLNTAGENIAWGTGSYAEPTSIMESWMKSPGHRANILKTNYLSLGVGYFQGHFTQVFYGGTDK
ncbi:CAP domain-containing protein [Bdellovibrio bacteriovorus]|uniref:CAP domain-containing protein n=1 Tax=Bdellovibrio TaxID=958 RepID=UPI0035A97C26